MNRSWNLETMSSRDQSFTRDIEFTIDTNGRTQAGVHVSCIVLWFDVGFPASSSGKKNTLYIPSVDEASESFT